MVKLWKVTVNSWGWDSPMTCYAESREEAEKIRSHFPAADPIQYAGRFTAENARILLGK